MDLVADYAVPLPPRVIADLFGAPAHDYPRFRAWSDAMRALASTVAPADDAAQAASGFAAIRDEMERYLQILIEARRAQPRDDLAREPNAHLAFGHGIHFCLGAVSARTEARVAPFDLVWRLADLERADGAPWPPRKAFHVHGPERLTVRFAQRAAPDAECNRYCVSSA